MAEAPAPGAALEEGDVQALAASFRGELIQPDHPAYEEARRVWNGMIDKRPALIARCTGVADVVSAVNFARETGLPVAVRGGGHNVAGKAVCDGGIVVDLSGLKGVHVDPDARSARAQGGVTLGLLDRETQAFGLATPAGIVSTTGIAGLTLGGGIGWLSRKYGLASDNLISADVVTAAGETVTAGENENADLFWGLRGGGGNFGVVTSFQYRLNPVPPVLGGAVFHSGEDAADLLRFMREFAANAPDELSLVAGFLTAADVPFLPPEIHGTLVVALAVCYTGDLEDGEREVAPLRAFGHPLADVIGPMPYTALQTMFDLSLEPGLLNYWKANYLSEIADGVIEVVVEHAARMPKPMSSFFFQQMGGVIPLADAGATAFGHRDVAYDFVISARDESAAGQEASIAWARDFWTAMQPYASEAVYVNDLGEEGEDRVRAAYSTEKYARLVVLKDKYDPTNFFRLNQNIPPSR